MMTLETSIPYFDLSLQHANRDLLRHMKRPGSSEKFFDLINTIRSAKPEAVFRSNFIVGFPGEKEEHHQELIDFVSEAKITWAGYFPFSLEQDTAAYNYDNQIDPELARERVRELQRIQDVVTQNALLETVGQKRRVLIDSIEQSTATTRGFDSAPEIDGVIHVNIEGTPVRRGEMIDVEITDVTGVDRQSVLV
jgi:tRNA A37 methylthiotransferase MiaB